MVDQGLRFLLPVEVARKFGPVSANLEAGYWFTQSHSNQWILGLALSHDLSDRLELVAESYSVGKTAEARAASTTLDVGSRWKLNRSLVVLLMAGHSVGAVSKGAPQWVGYAGVQFLFNSGRRNPEITADSHPQPQLAP